MQVIQSIWDTVQDVEDALSNNNGRGHVPKAVLYVACLEKQPSNVNVARGWRMNVIDGHVYAEDYELPIYTDPRNPQTTLQRLVTEDSLCRGVVGSGYVREGIMKNNVYFLMYYEMKYANGLTKITPAGFILARIEGKGLYIDVICADRPQKPMFAVHKGGLLLALAAQYAKEHSLEQLTLSALPSVLTYYPQFNFAHRHSCDSPPSVVISQKLKANAKKRTPEENEDYDPYDDDELLDFMSDLQLNGFGTRHGSDCSTSGKTKQQIKQSIKVSRCGDDGFKMVSCLDNSLQLPSAPASKRGSQSKASPKTPQKAKSPKEGPSNTGVLSDALGKTKSKLKSQVSPANVHGKTKAKSLQLSKSA